MGVYSVRGRLPHGHCFRVPQVKAPAPCALFVRTFCKGNGIDAKRVVMKSAYFQGEFQDANRFRYVLLEARIGFPLDLHSDALFGLFLGQVVECQHGTNQAKHGEHAFAP